MCANADRPTYGWWVSGATLVTSLIACAIRLISARPVSGRTWRPFFSCRPATTLNRLALPARSPYPFAVPCTWVTPASTATRVLATPQAVSSWQWMPSRACVRAADGGDDVAEFVRHHAAVGVAQRDQVGAGLHGRPDHFQGVVRVGPVAVEEVLGVEEDPLPVLAQVGDRVRDHREVLLQRGPQGEKDVPVVTLGDKGHDRRARFAQRGDQGVVGRLHAGPAGRAERGELRVLEVQFGDGAAEELGVLRDRAGPAALDEPDTELVQLPRDDELVGHAEVQALLLRAVSQGRVVDVKGVVEHRNVSWD